MSEVSGIEVVKYLYNESPDTKSIIISAYEDFEYAKYAVEYKVEKILIKPTDYDEFVNLMHKLKRELDERKTQQKYREYAKNISESIYRYSIEKKEKISANDMIELISVVEEFGGKDVASVKYQLFDIEISDYETLMEKTWIYGKESFNNLIKNFMREYLTSCEVYQLDSDGYRIKYIACSVEYETAAKLREVICDGLLKMCERLDFELEIKAVIKMGLSCESAYELFEDKFEAEASMYDNMTVIKMAKKYIDENFDKDISLHDLGKHVNMNSAYFSRIFKQVTNKNFIDYLTDIRIEKAKQLVLNGNFKVSEIAEKVGYRSVSYFGRIFKQATGCTPREYYIREAMTDSEG